VRVEGSLGLDSLGLLPFVDKLKLGVRLWDTWAEAGRLGGCASDPSLERNRGKSALDVAEMMRSIYVRPGGVVISVA